MEVIGFIGRAMVIFTGFKDASAASTAGSSPAVATVSILSLSTTVASTAPPSGPSSSLDDELLLTPPMVPCSSWIPVSAELSLLQHARSLFLDGNRLGTGRSRRRLSLCRSNGQLSESFLYVGNDGVCDLLPGNSSLGRIKDHRVGLFRRTNTLCRRINVHCVSLSVILIIVRTIVLTTPWPWRWSSPKRQ